MIATHVGFAGGSLPHPTYQQVCGKQTGHAEVVLVHYDERKLPLNQLLAFFFSLHDATLDRRAKGGQYRSIIGFPTLNNGQSQQVAQILQQVKAAGYLISTEFNRHLTFYAANGRHQRYCDSRSIAPKPPKGLPKQLFRTFE